MKALKSSLNLSMVVIISIAMFVTGCQQASNTGTTDTTATASPGPSISPSPGDNTRSEIDTKEPEGYRATIILKAETTGNRQAALPSMTAQVARMGADRRVSFKLLNGEQVVYLNRGDTRYVILPDRKQYAEINTQSAGFNMPSLMMPAEIVSHLKTRRGFERVGEEQMDGRTVVKYRHAGAARTGTQAGDVNAETFVYVDKETGLPVRTEFLSQASKSVQGVQGVKIVTEMRDIKTDVDKALFDVPEGMNKVTAEEVREKVNTVMTAAVAIAGALVNNMNASEQQGR